MSDVDPRPTPTAAPRRPWLKPTMMALGILAAASVPVLGLGQGSATPPARPGPDAGAAAPAPAAPAAASPTPAPAPGGDARPRAYPRVSVGTDDGAEPVAPPVFECKPVRHDASADDNQFPVPQPPFTKDVYPCTRCHEKPEDHNETRRTLTLDHLYIKLNHGPREQWCYGCHNPTSRNTLRLAGGREISFDRSYELCGQCHGDKLRDWRVGIHGRRTGCWNGQREYLLCVHCHNPHSPKFKQLKPKPRPLRPSEIQLHDHAGGTP